MKLTQAKIDKYVANPNSCPYCDSTTIIADDFDPESNCIRINCHNCDNSWYEVFELKTIEQNGE